MEWNRRFLLCALVLSKIWSRPVCTAYRLKLTKIRCVQVLPKKFIVRKGVTCYHWHCLRRAKNALKIENEHYGHVKRTEKNINVAAKPWAPLSCTHPNKVALALKEKRIECTNQKATIERMQREIEEKGVEVESDLRRSVCDTMTEKRRQDDAICETFFDRTAEA